MAQDDEDGGGDGDAEECGGRSGEPKAAARFEPTAQVGEQVAHRRIAIAGREGEAATENGAKLGRHAPAAGCRREAALDLVDQVVGLARAEGTAAIERFMEGDAEAELIGARVASARAEGLGRHVSRGSAGDGRDIVLERGDPEVRDPDPAVRADEDVLGFEVAMDDTCLMRR
ncbi:MAG TPA: hypothetical protein VLM79_33580 [Kofleriaceae bacterium]|nr:hypothetical protein [Kofleriaceae bacterium]